MEKTTTEAARANLGTSLLRSRCETLEYWDGQCMDLAQDISEHLDGRGVPHYRLWLEAEGKTDWMTSVHGHRWMYHVVVVVDGEVHDPWHAEVLPLETYMRSMFPNQNIAAEKVEDGPEVFPPTVFKNFQTERYWLKLQNRTPELAEV